MFSILLIVLISSKQNILREYMRINEVLYSCPFLYFAILCHIHRQLQNVPSHIFANIFLPKYGEKSNIYQNHIDIIFYSLVYLLRFA